MAKARPIPGLHEDDPYALVAAEVVATRAQELVDHSAGVLDIADIERVHAMRVATRRLRAALEVFEPCFARKRYKRALREVKALADALGERRDRDVAIAALTEFAAARGEADRPGVEGLVANLREEQRRANAELEQFVSPLRLTELGLRLEELVAGARSLAAGADRNGGRPRVKR
jgi:CHAD domain-containing protein